MMQPPNAPRGFRNNNPFNIRKTDIAWRGEVPGQDNAFESFDNPAAGIRAGLRNMSTHQQKYGARTLAQLLQRHAPPVENDTGAYIQAVAQNTGLDPNAEVDLSNPDVAFQLANAVIRHENGALLPEDVVRAGVNEFMGGNTPAAPAKYMPKSAKPVYMPKSARPVAEKPLPAADEMPAADDGVTDILGPLKRDATGQLFLEPTPNPGFLEALDHDLGTDLQGTFETDKPWSERGGWNKLLTAVPSAVDAILPDDPGGAFLGGLRDAAVGAATLPADVASYFGSDVYQPTADFIRKNVPEFRQDDTAGKVMQTITQYAAPGAKGAQLGTNTTSAVLKNAGPTVQKVGKVLGGMTGAAAADAAVTDPADASTLGDLFNFGPTDIQPDDTNLGKRAKVGAETFLVEPVVRGAVAVGRGVKEGAKAVGRTIEPFTKKGQERIARQYLQSQASDTAKAAEGIDKTLKSVNTDEGFMPLSGEASNDPGLIAAQRSMMNTTKRGTGTEAAPGEQILARSVQNQEAVAKQFENLTKPSKTGDPAALKPAARAEEEAIFEAPRKAVAETTQKLEKLNADLQTEAANLASVKGRKTAASENIDAQIRQLDQQMTDTKNTLFKEADPDGTLRAQADDLAEEIDAIKLEEGQDPAHFPKKLTDDIKRLIAGETDNLAEDGGRSAAEADWAKLTGGETPTPAEAGTISFRALVNLRQRVATELVQARANGLPVDNLVRVKEALERKIDGFADDLGEEGAAASAKLREAQDFYANQFGPRFKKGEGGRLRKEQKSGRPGAAPPSATAGRFLDPARAGAKERAGDLARLIGQDNPQAREYLISDLADNVTDGQKVNLPKLDRWIEKHREALATNPTLRKEVAQMRNRLDAGGKQKGQIEADLEAATAGLKKTETEVKENALRLFLDYDDPLDAVGKIMAGTNKAQKMRQAVTAAKRDPSGKALEGLKDTVKMWGRKKMTQSAESLGGRPLVSSAKLNAAAKDPGVLEALSVLYKDSPQDLKALRQIRTNLNVLSRPQRVQGTAGSATEPIRQQANEFRTLIASAVGITQGRGYFQIGKWIQTLTGKDPQPIIEQLVVDAMLDPKLAKTMLTTAEPKNIPLIEKELRTYISNNIVGDGERRKEQNKEGKE